MLHRKSFAPAFVAAACLLLGTSQVSSAQSPVRSGTASFQLSFVQVDGQDVLGFAYDEARGGRIVQLVGDIEGTNFEPGVCNEGIDVTSLPFPSYCVAFGDGPGQFTRLRPGGTAFTTCECTVDGVGEAGDSFILKISYPPATPPQYPAGFTKFTIQGGTGALAGLRGQGTLDFSVFAEQITFKYHFAGR